MRCGRTCARCRAATGNVTSGNVPRCRGHLGNPHLLRTTECRHSGHSPHTVTASAARRSSPPRSRLTCRRARSEPHKTARSFDIAPETTDAAQAHCAGAYAPVRLSASRQPSRPNTTIGRVAAIWPAFSMAARLAPSAAAQAVHPPTRRRVNTPTPSTPHRPRGLHGASRRAVLALSTPQPRHG